MTDDTPQDEAPTITVPDGWAEELLDFWFDQHGKADWFGGGEAFDAKIIERFEPWRQALRSFPHDHFMIGAATALAAVLLFDQVPRNSHRGHAESFSTDSLALAIARAAVARGYDEALDTDHRAFLYLPFEHSEDLEDQRESVRRFAALGDADYLDFARRHFAVIERFGRFPHRNAVLGRADRAGEAEAVADGAHW